MSQRGPPASGIIGASPVHSLHADSGGTEMRYHPSYEDSLVGSCFAVPGHVGARLHRSRGSTRAFTGDAGRCSPDCPDEGAHRAAAGAAPGPLHTVPADGDRSAGCTSLPRVIPRRCGTCRATAGANASGTTGITTASSRHAWPTAPSPSGSPTESAARSASTLGETRCRCSMRVLRFSKSARRSKEVRFTLSVVDADSPAVTVRLTWNAAYNRFGRGGSLETHARSPTCHCFARFFEAVHEGVYIGTISCLPDADGGATLAANPLPQRSCSAILRRR